MNAFDLPTCLENTRVDVRNELTSHLLSDTLPNVLWLHGVAGSGKSTVATTIAEDFNASSRLGAYMFFQRQKSNPGAFVRTLAYKLSMYDPAIASRVEKALESNNYNDLATASTQFTNLLLTPLRTVAEEIQGPIVIILDALDECGSRGTRQKLMDVLQKVLPQLPSCFRFLITSRREADIEKTFGSRSMKSSIRIFELDYTSDVSKRDVDSYIRVNMIHLLEDVVDDNYPWEEMLSALSTVAEGLFIFASTAVRLVAESMNPLQKFEDLVRDSRSHEGFGLYRLYSTVLRDCGIPWNDPKWRPNFINVLGLILLGKTFFSVADIDGLLGLPPGESSDLVLSRLKCLLDYSPTGPIRLLHTSFSDYLLSPGCPTPCPTHPESDHRERDSRERSPDCVYGLWLIDAAAQ